MTESEPLLTRKELAEKLRRNVCFVARMRALGFKMPGGTATLSEARIWLLRNPFPFSRRDKSSKVVKSRQKSTS